MLTALCVRFCALPGPDILPKKSSTSYLVLPGMNVRLPVTWSWIFLMLYKEIQCLNMSGVAGVHCGVG